MKRLYVRLRDALRQGEDCMLLSIIESSGSSPRGAGAKLALFADGSTEGTIGGGSVEHQSVLLASDALKKHESFVKSFDLADGKEGMICGGRVSVYFQYISWEDGEALRLLNRIAGLFELKENTWLVTRIGGGMGIYSPADGLFLTDGAAAAEIAPLALSHAVLGSGEPAYFVEPLTRAGTVYVFGGGHVARELVPLLAHIGFSAAVYEDRPEFASRELFPAAERIICGSFEDISQNVLLSAEDYAVIMTRGHASDYEVLYQALQTDACYIGMMGSGSKVAATNSRLMAAGVPESALLRIHSPIGLNIGGETPAEIAVSIAAELIAVRAGTEGGGWS